MRAAAGRLSVNCHCDRGPSRSAKIGSPAAEKSNTAIPDLRIPVSAMGILPASSARFHLKARG